jgi:hypothetical protein
MVFRRVITWLRSKLAAPHRALPGNGRAAFDLDVFARLLNSDDPADLKRIASHFSSADPVDLWRELQDRLGNERVQR